MNVATPIGYAIGTPVGYPVGYTLGYGSDRPRNYNYKTTPTEQHHFCVVHNSPTVTREAAE
jgi:hypothetical protein